MFTLAILSIRKPAIALSVVLCTYGIEQWIQSHSYFFVAHQTLNNYATGVVLLIGLTSMIVKGEQVFSPYPKVGWVTIALFLFSLLSITWSVYPTGTLEQFKKHGPYLITVIVLSPLLVVNPRDLQSGLFMTMLVGALVAALLIFTTEITNRFVRLTGGTGIGSMADKGNPLAIATLAGHIVLISVLLNFRGLGRIYQLLRWFIVPLGLILSIKSGSRGQLFALLTALLIFLPISRRLKNVKSAVVVFGSVLVIGAVAMVAHDLFAEHNRWEWDSMVDTYSSSRITQAKYLISLWLQGSPFTWIFGLGNSASYDPNILGIYPHLVMAEVLAEEGLIGFCLLWTIVIFTFKSLATIYNYASDFPDARGVTAAIGALFLFEVILSFKQGSMLLSSFAFAFAIIIGRFELGVLRCCEQPEAAAENLAKIPP